MLQQMPMMTPMMTQAPPTTTQQQPLTTAAAAAPTQLAAGAPAPAACQTVAQARARAHTKPMSIHRCGCAFRHPTTLLLTNARRPQIIQSAPNLAVLRAVLSLLPNSFQAQLSQAAGSGAFMLFAPSDAAFRCAAHTHARGVRARPPSALPACLRCAS
jgi:uncharacterized surface protein with fasciclin (FAS1) repeats